MFFKSLDLHWIQLMVLYDSLGIHCSWIDANVMTSTMNAAPTILIGSFTSSQYGKGTSIVFTSLVNKMAACLFTSIFQVSLEHTA